MLSGIGCVKQNVDKRNDVTMRDASQNASRTFELMAARVLTKTMRVLSLTKRSSSYKRMGVPPDPLGVENESTAIWLLDRNKFLFSFNEDSALIISWEFIVEVFFL